MDSYNKHIYDGEIRNTPPHPSTHTQYPVWPQNLFLFEVDLLNPIICIGTHGIPPRCILSNYMVCKIKGTASII